MNIRYGCVTLRAIEMEDVGLLKHLLNAPEVEVTTVGWNMPVSTYQQEQWMLNYRNSSDCMRWMIELENGTVLGMAILSSIDWKNRTACLGIKINPNEGSRIHGDVKDAVYGGLRYAFDELGLHRIDAETLSTNFFSLKLTRSMGFTDEGIKRECIFKAGEWHDLIVGGLLEQDFVRYQDGTAPWQRKRMGLGKDTVVAGADSRCGGSSDERA